MGFESAGLGWSRNLTLSRVSAFLTSPHPPPGMVTLLFPDPWVGRALRTEWGLGAGAWDFTVHTCDPSMWFPAMGEIQVYGEAQSVIPDPLVTPTTPTLCLKVCSKVQFANTYRMPTKYQVLS